MHKNIPVLNAPGFLSEGGWINTRLFSLCSEHVTKRLSPHPRIFPRHQQSLPGLSFVRISSWCICQFICCNRVIYARCHFSLLSKTRRDFLNWKKNSMAVKLTAITSAIVPPNRHQLSYPKPTVESDRSKGCSWCAFCTDKCRESRYDHNDGHADAHTSQRKTADLRDMTYIDPVYDIIEHIHIWAKKVGNDSLYSSFPMGSAPKKVLLSCIYIHSHVGQQNCCRLKIGVSI